MNLPLLLRFARPRRAAMLGHTSEAVPTNNAAFMPFPFGHLPDMVHERIKPSGAWLQARQVEAAFLHLVHSA